MIFFIHFIVYNNNFKFNHPSVLFYPSTNIPFFLSCDNRTLLNHVVFHFPTNPRIVYHHPKCIFQNPCLYVFQIYMFLITKILSFISSSIWPCVCTFSMHISSIKISFIFTSINPMQYTFPM